jgi:hypothetical protein
LRVQEIEEVVLQRNDIPAEALRILLNEICVLFESDENARRVAPLTSTWSAKTVLPDPGPPMSR